VEDVMPEYEPYQLFPDLTADEYKALRDDIKARGVQVPVEFDEDGHILDGYHRWKICQELDKECPSVERTGLTEAQKLEHILKMNLARRHLTRDALKPVALKLRQQSWPHRRIAKELGVGRSTVHRWLTDVSQMGHVATPTVITDTRGRQQPARKARTPKSIDGAAPDETVAEAPPPPPTNCLPETRLAETASTPAVRVPEPGAPVLIPSHPPAPRPSAGRPLEPEPTQPLPTASTDGPLEQPSVERASSSSQGPLPIPPTDNATGEVWVHALEDLSARLQALQGQGNLAQLSAQWPPKTKVWCVAMMRRMAEVYVQWADVLGQVLGEADGPHHHGDRRATDISPLTDKEAFANLREVKIQ
jgi:Homeodomain-like domain